MRFKDLSIPIKLVTIQLLTVVIALVLGSAVLIYTGLHSLKSSRVANLTSLTQVVALNSISSLEFMDEEAGAGVLASLKEETSITHATVLNADKEVFATYQRPGQSPFDFTLPDQENEEDSPTLTAEGPSFFDDYLVVRQSIQSEEEVLGWLLIRSDLQEMSEANRQYVLRVLILLLGSILIASVISLIFQRSISHPVRDLVQDMNTITKTGSYTARTRLDRKDELGQLSQEFDQMLKVIQSKEQELNRLNEDLEAKVADRTEQLRSAFAQLRAKAEELQEVTYVISHDLRTPLRGISSIAEWLREDLELTPGSDTHSQLDLLMERVERMHRLTQALIHYVEAGRSSGKVEQVHLEPIIQTLTTNFSNEHPVQFTLPQHFPVVSGDQERIFRVFFVLVENALVHCDKDHPHINLSLEEVEGFWLIKVTDNGPGIDPRYHDKIFAMFQTLEEKDKIGKIGAGLPIAKRIVEEAGGKISVDSQSDEGATFSVWWPKG